MSISISPSIEEKLAQIAAISGRDINVLFEDIVSESLDEELRYLRAVQEGLDDIAAGRVVPHEEAMRELMATIERAAAEGGQA